MEVYVLVERKRPILLKICGLALLVTGGISLLFTAVGLFVFLPVAVVGILLGAFLHTRNYEYEYSYFDGDIRFAKIINKSRRKNLKGYAMNEVITIAPIGDRSVHQYLNNSDIKKKDYTSKKADRNIYVMVVKVAGGIDVIKFEPDDKYLDAVCIKYRQKVVR